MEIENPINFRLPDAKWTISLSPEVAELLRVNRQHLWSSERVGQLYCSNLASTEILICHATKLRNVRGARFRANIDVVEAAEERAKLFTTGLHCIGFWHSHPEKRPSPSSEDEEFAMDHARAAAEQLTGLIFIILGNGNFPDSLYVGVHDGKHFRRLSLCSKS